MNSIVFSNKGKRDVNQDFVLVQNINPETHLYMIADGMGGYEHGEIAAKMAAENVLTFLSTVETINETQIQIAINKANLAIRQLREKNNCKIGATIGGVILYADRAICFWVGDVKIFHFKNNRLVKESVPHTLMNKLISNGSITDPKQISKYRHVVTRSIQGDIKSSQIDLFILENLNDSDILLLCSDGAHELLDGIHLQQILNTSESNEEALDKIEKHLLKESNDNFSLICLSCKELKEN